MKKYFIAVAFFAVTPSIAFASWWNPLSWNWTNLFSSPTPLVVQVPVATTTPVQTPIENSTTTATTSIPVTTIISTTTTPVVTKNPVKKVSVSAQNTPPVVVTAPVIPQQTLQGTQSSFCQNEGWICAKAASYGNPNTSSTIPVVTNITGPAVVDVGQQGTWMVSAQDPQNKILSYSVNWGDASTTCAANYTCLANSAPVAYFSQVPNFTHVYATSGVYMPTFTVEDSARITTQATITVEVSSTQASTTVSAAPAYSLASTPTITKQYVGGSSTAAFYTAMFNLVVKTGNAAVALDLPNSQHQAIIAQVYNYIFMSKNNNTIPYTESYSAPSNSTLSADGNSFTIPANQTVTIPVTINFTDNYGAIPCQVAIQQINSSAGSDNSMAQNQSRWQTNSL